MERPAKGDGPNALHLDPRPADLSDAEYMAGATDQSIFSVIERGGRALDLPPTMPIWGKTLSREQIVDLVAYVWTLSKTPSKSDDAEMKQPTRLAENKTPTEADCRVCHVKSGERHPIAPDLGQEGSKLNKNWVYGFLKKPTKIRPVGYMPLTKSVMPDFQLTDEEALSLTEYLMARQDPRIPKMGSTEFRSTPEAVKEGKRLYEEVYGCDGCHQTGDKGGIAGPNLSQAGNRLRTEWIVTWLRNPGSLRQDSPMPNFGLQDHEIKALLAYILSVSEGPPPASPPANGKTPSELIEKGKSLARDKNCAGCHIFDMNNGKDRTEQKPQKIAEGRSVT